MADFVLKEVVTSDIFQELFNIGFDEGYRFVAGGKWSKYRYKNFKIFDLTLPQANILKQIALSFGADCAVHRETITGKIEKTDALLGGSYSQLKKISEALKNQPFSMGKLAEVVLNELEREQRKTKLVGIFNATPDSFSNNEIPDKPECITGLIEDGADVIDIGAESTRPGFTPVDDEEQINRLKPVLEFIQKENISIPISVDTRSSIVAEFALDNGAEIINDVSGFESDSKMPDIISKYNAGVIIQHWSDVTAKENFIDEIYLSLKQKAELAQSKGIADIILDPGIGFGKNKIQNYEIINRVEEFFSLGFPIMLGVSRKSLLGVTENNNELKDALTLAVSSPLIKKGVDYLRVHNVKLHRKLADIL